MGGDPKNVVVDDDENEKNADWRKNFTAFVRNNLPSSSSSYSNSSLALRELISNPRVGLHFQDIQNNPNKFFDAHELLARRSPELGPGFWIRFTVHFNLFAGTGQRPNMSGHGERN